MSKYWIMLHNVCYLVLEPKGRSAVLFSSVGPSSVNLSDNSKNSAHKGSLMIGSYIRYSINYISFGLVSDEASCLKAVSIF